MMSAPCYTDLTLAPLKSVAEYHEDLENFLLEPIVPSESFWIDV